jgi:deoxyribonuclease-4
MALFGAHMSMAGGLHRALEAAGALGMEACQLFCKSNKQWRAAPLSADAAAKFQETRLAQSIEVCVVHAAYLITLAAADAVLHARSVDALIEEWHRCEQLGVEYLVVHPGAAKVEADGLERVAEAVLAALASVRPQHTRLLLETTAGQGQSLGHRFEHLGSLLRLIDRDDHVGVCLDTCHVFAAGYALSPKKAYVQTLRTFDQVVGLHRLFAFHINDSKMPLGSRVDRHAHLGHGAIGSEAFAALVRDRRFRQHPMILETPKGMADADQTWDAVNLHTLRQLAGSGRKTPRNSSTRP